MKSTAIRRLRVREIHPDPHDARAESLRRHGLPLVVRPRHRLRTLVPYTGPVLVVLGVLLMVQAVTARVMLAASERFDVNIWQIAVGISWLNVALTAAVLVILANVLNVVVTADIVGDSHLRDHLRDSTTRARWSERANIIAVPSLVVTIQAGIFSVLVFIFLVGFGMLSIPVATIKQWISQDPNIVFRWLMPGLPLTQELLKVCLVLAAFAGLNFVASMATDQRHRTLFMDGVLNDLDQGLKVREQYPR